MKDLIDANEIRRQFLMDEASRYQELSAHYTSKRMIAMEKREYSSIVYYSNMAQYYSECVQRDLFRAIDVRAEMLRGGA